MNREVEQVGEGPLGVGAARGVFREEIAGRAVGHVADRGVYASRPQGLRELIPAGVVHDEAHVDRVPALGVGRGLAARESGRVDALLGAACSSLRSLLTVHSMVIHAVTRFGSPAQRERWLPPLASGAILAGFALSEPEVGSDAAAIQTAAGADGEGYSLTRGKPWRTLREGAGRLLVFARTDAGPTAFLVETSLPGVRRLPIRDMLGVRASMLAAVHLEDCRVPADARLGKPGLGVTFVAQSALDWGRLSDALGYVGIARRGLPISGAHAEQGRQFHQHLGIPMDARHVALKMLVETRAARLLCERAADLKDRGDPRSLAEVSAAKYYATRAASRAATDAVQILGANGCSPDYPVERLLRDARIMEIIEGSNEMHQLSLAEHALHPDPTEP